MKYWNENRKQYYTHVEPRADWRGPVEKWIDWMGVIGRSKQTLRTRYYQLSRFSRVVNKKINDVNEDDLILVLALLGAEAKRGMRAAVRMFYSWAIERKLATADSTAGIPPIAMEKGSRQGLPRGSHREGSWINQQRRTHSGDARRVLWSSSNRDRSDQSVERYHRRRERHDAENPWQR